MNPMGNVWFNYFGRTKQMFWILPQEPFLKNDVLFVTKQCPIHDAEAGIFRLYVRDKYTFQDLSLG